ncbi:hypothetical protein GCM10009654_15380 [Streptomyces hebeiensis]|uniref:Uncharacterized protein n=1 Tax=Streptomyces hebeiensis TaxID=229486 RepID=A0ABN1UNQ1_9ACTN
MGNRPDEYGTDVEIYRKALTLTIHADTRTGAREQLLALLDSLGFDRHDAETAGPAYVWHEAPAHLGLDEQKRLASRAIPALLVAGYTVNCTPDAFDEGAYQQAVHEIRSGRTRRSPRAQPPAPSASPASPARSRRTP